ncbi:ferrous iron transport protein B [Clostridium argentinense CDC 2741]|uniref:Ferrous iron transport protein B n=1 Tax=Clostridium argentinense CDC 2741 TaxID=1418104 RepID=A0A0C1TYC9_9CLOT|nr:ferrous iron transport protein B [Clostridium argentinense]ARC83987.1 ferrous iron transporter B [Clostridium argentinense]KIE44348.1 ferrous iron transport protein B [Clostridium argentinense CDC 2741]NFF39408.1 ferrous iron transport protein B [Clostridium argentinense]NFP50387.1 ferrous iron transport protein B [Clostridium argentinense]NFP74193.1 ferrous iron transport protein B [Clostridium argentinense]
MGLTFDSTKKKNLEDIQIINKKKDNQSVIALAGNPNTGKSTVFNALTGLRQHTGNWPGKTVVNFQGSFNYKEKEFILVDLPGTYSLLASSTEEEVARDYICFGNADLIVVVLDATCIERNLNLLLQILEITPKVLVCLNLMDEAKKKNIKIDIDELSKKLKVPIIPTSARSGIGIGDLKEAIYENVLKEEWEETLKINYSEDINNEIDKISSLLEKKCGGINYRWTALRLLDGDESIKQSIRKYVSKDFIVDDSEIEEEIKNFREKQNNKVRDIIVSDIYEQCENIVRDSVNKSKNKILQQQKIDNILTSKATGIPIMLLMLTLILWITIEGANVPSELLAKVLFSFEDKLMNLLITIKLPIWLREILVLGVYKTLAWVVSVMLPPMAIFFPLFTILEDSGYLPRVCFNLDKAFKKACCHGKQVLTMCMGFGCNAAGVIACRIIDSPRERLIAILTNSFVPCNGRFPTLIALSIIFVGGTFASDRANSIVAALMVVALVVLGVVITLISSFILSKTILKGIPSSFTLELPPYRKPQIGRVIYTSIIDRTIFVLFRAMVVAAPAGLITYILSNVMIGDMSIVAHIANFLQPFGKLIGLDGYILMAFLLGLPANEIVLPILLMGYLSNGVMIEHDSIEQLKNILVNNGWTYLTLLNTMLFSLLHFPCGTTIWTIKKETGSNKWALVSFLMPTAVAIVVCFITTLISKIIF